MIWSISYGQVKGESEINDRNRVWVQDVKLWIHTPMPCQCPLHMLPD